MGSGFLKRKKEMRAMQEKLSAMQTQMDTVEVEGSAGNGLVSVTLLGNGYVKSIKIKPECIDKDDADGLQDLLRAAFNEAKKKADEESVQGLGGMPSFPGF